MYVYIYIYMHIHSGVIALDWWSVNVLGLQDIVGVTRLVDDPIKISRPVAVGGSFALVKIANSTFLTCENCTSCWKVEATKADARRPCLWM
jgi:hypothetical protein